MLSLGPFPLARRFHGQWAWAVFPPPSEILKPPGAKAGEPPSPLALVLLFGLAQQLAHPSFPNLWIRSLRLLEMPAFSEFPHTLIRLVLSEGREPPPSASGQLVWWVAAVSTVVVRLTPVAARAFSRHPGCSPAMLPPRPHAVWHTWRAMRQ